LGEIIVKKFTLFLVIALSLVLMSVWTLDEGTDQGTSTGLIEEAHAQEPASFSPVKALENREVDRKSVV
jgi:hypothetical protein